ILDLTPIQHRSSFRPMAVRFAKQAIGCCNRMSAPDLGMLAPIPERRREVANCEFGAGGTKPPAVNRSPEKSRYDLLADRSSRLSRRAVGRA
ncbi:MAG: hypothetical protein ACLGHY_11330, partial [Gammaproteobacteria bacterium]